VKCSQGGKAKSLGRLMPQWMIQDRPQTRLMHHPGMIRTDL